MRFGSVSEDDDTVTSVLAERTEHFLERLRVLEGAAEYNIKANHDEEAVLRLIMADHDDIRTLAKRTARPVAAHRRRRSSSAR